MNSIFNLFNPHVMAQRVFISIGSNLGQRTDNCRSSIRRLLQNRDITLRKKSSFYETAPWGVTGQGPFINAVVEVRTYLPPRALLDYLKSVEREMGRAPAMRWRPRVIDLDIIFYGDKVIQEKGLTVPHPHLHERPFVLVPLYEIAPDFIHPVLKKSISGLLAALGASPYWVKRI